MKEILIYEHEYELEVLCQNNDVWFGSSYV